MDAVAKTQHCAVLIDRRIDPDRRLTLQGGERPLREWFVAVADEVGGRASFGDGVVYLAPSQAAARVRTIIAIGEAQAARLSAAQKKVWLERRLLEWPDFTAPRELVSQLAMDAGVELTGIEKIPHDLWGAASLPAMSLVARLSYVLNQYDLELVLAHDGRRGRIIPVGAEHRLERRYPAGPSAAKSVARIKQLAPSAHVATRARDLMVAATLEEHERIAGVGSPGKKQPAPASALEQIRIERLTLQSLPLAAVIEQLSERLQLETTFDQEAARAAGIDPQQLINVELRDATVDDLLRATLEPADLTYRREGRKVTVLPKSNSPTAQHAR
ncbi:MAG: STN domain-containing protein [Pirellulales bacterium]|nr:STN domain-containing protein [Pirellulales bacterium]